LQRSLRPHSIHNTHSIRANTPARTHTHIHTYTHTHTLAAYRDLKAANVLLKLDKDGKVLDVVIGDLACTLMAPGQTEAWTM
jgi:hypothetical protein